MLALVGVVENGGGENQGASHHEVGKIAHKGGGSAFQQQLQQNFHAFADHGGAGPQVKSAQQHGQLGKVQLVEFRRENHQRKVQHMEHGGDGGADADDADPPGGTDLPLFREKTLLQPCQQGKPHHDGEAHAHECQIV